MSNGGTHSLIRWTEVRALVPDGWHELIAEALTVGPCTSVAFGRPSLATDEAPRGFDYVRTFIPAHADSPALRDSLTSAVASLAERAGARELARIELVFRALPPEDYATSWKKSWKPFRVGRLSVIAPWSASRPRATDIVMRLEPGGAFGSGRHATTRACLRVLQRRLQPGERVLDAGSGSGILSVAAALFGARRALGFDVDPNAEPYARELAQDNRAGVVCEFRTGAFESLRSEDGGFDAVLANLYADVIQAHASDLCARLVKGGWFAFSGCPMQHAHATRAAIERSGLAIESVDVRGRWHTFVGRRT